MSNKINRRRFLAGSAVAAAVIVPRHVLGGAGHTPPSEKLNIAGIGVGGMGASNLRNLESQNIVALCDVDHTYAAKTFKRCPQAKMNAYQKPEKTIPRVNTSHEMEWVAACIEGREAGADFVYSGRLTEACLLGNVARQVDTRIHWDHENLKVTNIPEANKLIRTAYREGWSLGEI